MRHVGESSTATTSPEPPRLECAASIERQAARLSPPQGRGGLGGRKPARQGRLLSSVRLSSISAVAFSLTSARYGPALRDSYPATVRAPGALFKLGSFTGSSLTHRTASFDPSGTLAPVMAGGGHLLVLQKTKFKRLRRGDFRIIGFLARDLRRTLRWVAVRMVGGRSECPVARLALALGITRGCT